MVIVVHGTVPHFTKDVHSQSVQANEAAVRAARIVLEREFPRSPNSMMKAI